VDLHVKHRHTSLEIQRDRAQAADCLNGLIFLLNGGARLRSAHVGTTFPLPEPDPNVEEERLHFLRVCFARRFLSIIVALLFRYVPDEGVVDPRLPTTAIAPKVFHYLRLQAESDGDFVPRGLWAPATLHHLGERHHLGKILRRKLASIRIALYRGFDPSFLGGAVSSEFFSGFGLAAHNVTSNFSIGRATEADDAHPVFAATRYLLYIH
jgi:hypothetical protein